MPERERLHFNRLEMEAAIHRTPNIPDPPSDTVDRLAAALHTVADLADRLCGDMSLTVQGRMAAAFLNAVALDQLDNLNSFRDYQ